MRQLFHTACANAHLECRISLGLDKAGLYGETYFVTHDGKRYFLSDHLTRGGGGGIRIYYAMDDETGKVVVGHLPTHLQLHQ